MLGPRLLAAAAVCAFLSLTGFLTATPPSGGEMSPWSFAKSSPSAANALFSSLPVQCPTGPKKCGTGRFLLLCPVPDEWVTPLSIVSGKSAKFYRACEKHDACYDTYGADRAACDKAFWRDLEEECAKGFDTALLQPGKISCNAAARTYYEVVAANGAEPFKHAQAAAKAQAQAQIEGFCRDILGREAKPEEVEARLEEHKGGAPLSTIRRRFAESPEALAKVNSLFRKMLCRDADPDGLKTWVNALATGWTLRRVADEGIAASPEYRKRGGKPCR